VSRVCGCGTTVLDTLAGTLDAAPHPLGIYRPGGTRLTIHDIAVGKIGHRKHWQTTACTTGEQYDLFSATDEADRSTMDGGG